MVKFRWLAKPCKHLPPHSEKDSYSPSGSPYQERDHASTSVFPNSSVAAIPTTNTTLSLSLPPGRTHPEQKFGPLRCLSMSDVTHQPDSDHRIKQGAATSKEKSLPPTPTSSSEGASDVHSYRMNPSIEGPSWPYQQSRQDPQSAPAPPTVRPSPSQAKVALAQATLAICLPHSIPIPQASTSSPHSDVNSIAFVTIPHPQPEPEPEPDRLGFPPSTIRRAKSFQQLTRNYRKQDDPHSDSQMPRSRRISFGRVNALDPNEKGKDKPLEGIPSHVTPPRVPLVRRASFWSRKRDDSSKSSVAPLPPQHPSNSVDHLSHILPSLPPMSPFHIDANVSYSSRSPQTEEQSPPGLSDRRNHPLPPRPAASSPDLSLSLRPPPPHPPRRRRPATADSAPDRPRTLSFAFSSVYPSTSPPSPSQHADSSTFRQRPRPRSQTNPPFLHRLSTNIFSFGSSSPSPSTSTIGAYLTHSPGASPRASTSKLPPPKPLLDSESPASYVNRLLSTISKVEVASVLAQSGESFYTSALNTYIGRFEFDGDPLDIALRKLLMDVGLPRETQQIDRVIEAFANRYLTCNPSLFTSNDHPYILAFSLIMLHTDAFNKSNKRKMTKADYIRNTKLPDIYPEVLDYYYDNVVFAPFIFVEDPPEMNPQRNVDGGPSRLLTNIPSQHSIPGNGSTATLLGKSNKIDPYYLIAKNLLGPLRVDVEEFIPLENRYSYQGTSGPWNERDMHETFSKAGTIEIRGADRRMSTSVFSLSFHTSNSSLHQPSSSPYTRQVSSLRVAKAGLLNRNGTTLDLGKRAKASKWRVWSVILTTSQLLFFRDHAWAISLEEQMRFRDGGALDPPVSLLKPDDVLPLKNSVAVYDRSYDKRNTFLFVTGDRQSFHLQAPSEEDMNSWISCINYASAFRTTGVPMRAPDVSGKDVELMGVAAAASHLRDLQSTNVDPLASLVCSRGRSSDDLIGRLSASSSPAYTVSRSGRPKILSGRGDMDLDVPASPDLVGAHQLKATFDQVKAVLATGQRNSADISVPKTDGRPRACSLDFAALLRLPTSPETSEYERTSIRSRNIRSKLTELDSKIPALQLQEGAEIRLLRNVAVLTPFQRATRERLGAAVLQASKGIQRIRLELGMRLCHKEVLSNDLIAQEREWCRTKKIALKAATDALQSRREPNIPRTLPLGVDGPVADSSDERHYLPEGSHVPESSLADSLYSALEFDCRGRRVGEQLNSPLVSTNDWTPTDSPSQFTPPQTDDGNSTPETGRSQGFNTALEEPHEEAEEWDKTRAAKRVSLVRMPSSWDVSLGPHVSIAAGGSVWTTRSSRSTHER